MYKDKYQIDMCHGPLLNKIILFSLPLMSTYILQLLFNAADLVILGRYSTHQAMAAVGATANLNALLINAFIGLSIGTNVLASQFFGGRKFEDMQKIVHTSITVALYCGVLLTIIGLFIARPMLHLMYTPEEILSQSALYIKICFLAIPFILFYNFGCSVLRAVGDTRRPLYILVISGILNVVLNMFFVIVCHMSVGGVALATSLSHVFSAVMIFRILRKNRDCTHLNMRQLRIDGKMLAQMLKIGIPASIQSSCFSLSNLIIQSSINTFGATAIAGSTAASALEGIVYVGSFAYHQTALSFAAQNLGGHKFKRIVRSLKYCFLSAGTCTTVLGLVFFALGHPLLSIFSSDPDVISWGLLRMKVMFSLYGICGIMDVASGGLRGLGHSTLSTVVTLLGACAFRIWWVAVIFSRRHTMETLLISYPISWFLVAFCSCFFLYVFCRKIMRENRSRNVIWRNLKPDVPRGLRFLGASK